MNNIADLNNYKSLSKEHIQLGEYDLAIEKLKLCNKNDPKDLETLGLLGDAYVAIQSPKIASEFYEQLLNVDPFNTQALLKFSKIKLKGPNYLEVLKEYHQITKPERYIEIGVCRGASFSLANEETKAIGIDPNPQFEHIGELSANHIVISETSDDYFSCDKVENNIENKSFDMAFLDGMHLFEYALRDFINLEKKSAPGSVIFIHDLYPMNAETSTRERNSDFWSGDVWKLVLCLSEYRPDLDLKVLPCPPTGLGFVKNLDSASSVLEDNYDIILGKYVGMSYDSISRDKDQKLKLVSETNLDYLWQ